MKTDLFWYYHDHDGEKEIRSVVRDIGEGFAIIYPYTCDGVPHFHVKVHYTAAAPSAVYLETQPSYVKIGSAGTAWCESATFQTLAEAKTFAKKILFAKQ
jgi:hypothetical protein